MVNPELFFDTSALFSGIISPTGAARALLILAEAGRVNLTISMQVTIEMERTLSAKAPEVIASYRSVLKSAGVRIVANPSILESTAFENIIVHNEDAPILAAAVACSTDFLVTHNSKHFTEDPGIAQITGLRIGSPGDALAWVRQQFGITIPPGKYWDTTSQSFVCLDLLEAEANTESQLLCVTPRG